MRNKHYARNQEVYSARQAGKTYKEIGRAHSLSVERIRQICLEVERVLEGFFLYDGKLNISRRAGSALANHGIFTVDKLITYSIADLYKIRGLGRLSVNEIVRELTSSGKNLSSISRDAAPSRKLTPLQIQKKWSEQDMYLPLSLISRLDFYGVYEWRDLLSYTPADLLKLGGIGDYKLSIIEELLHDKGLYLKGVSQEEYLRRRH
jgi:DNA-directed RNA polymerase alpha subunit